MAKKKTTKDPISFEEELGKLEEVVRQLEDGQLGLSESLARYEEGVGHLRNCHEALASADRKIELLTSVDAGGKAETEAFEDEDATTGQKSKAKSSRRSTRVTTQPEDDAAGDVDTQRGLF